MEIFFELCGVCCTCDLFYDNTHILPSMEVVEAAASAAIQECSAARRLLRRRRWGPADRRPVPVVAGAAAFAPA